MAHEVETMMSVRLKPWHYEMTKDVTKIIQIAPNSHQALVAAGLDWTVESKPIYDAHGNIIKGFKANTRSSDSKVLGIVSDRYKIVQNVDAFQFTDNLIGGDVRYETAGSLLGGQKVWMLAKMPEKKIAGDDVETYVCFTNSHDGKGSVKAIVTPIRVVCQNTMNIALSRAQRSWSIRHQGNIENKIAEAREVLELTDIYMEELAKQAERWANVTINEDAFQKILNKIFPVKEDDTDRKKNNVQKQKDDFTLCYFAPDLVKFQKSAWGVINAATDYVAHSEPARMTQNYHANNWNRIMEGHPIVDKVVDMLKVAV